MLRRRTAAPLRRTINERLERSTSSSSRVRVERNPPDFASTQTMRLFPTAASVTASQRPCRVATTPSARCDPNGVREPTRASTGPNGRLRSARARPGRTSAITCAGFGFGALTCTHPADVAGRSRSTRPTAVAGASAAAPVLTQTSETRARIDRATLCGSAGPRAHSSLERGTRMGRTAYYSHGAAHCGPV
jgi:hypothetical protein